MKLIIPNIVNLLLGLANTILGFVYSVPFNAFIGGALLMAFLYIYSSRRMKK